jgi:predicted nucleic acid-binding protein
MIHGWFAAAVANGDIAVCDMVVLELLHSASSPALYRQLEDELRAMPWVRMGRTEWERAITVYGLLSDRGRAAHRSVPHADLLIAAAAEISGIELVHYDRDYDLIAGVTGQPAAWARPRGSL